MSSIRGGWLDNIGPMRLQHRRPSPRENFWCFLDASRSTGMNQFLDAARNVLAGVPSRVKSGRFHLVVLAAGEIRWVNTKCECEGFSERNRVAAGSQWKEPHYRRDYSFTSRKITKRKRLQGPACDSFRRLGQSGSGGKSRRDLGPIAANSASAYANRDTLRLASPNGQAWYEALDSPTPARVAIYSFRGLSPNSEFRLSS